MITVISGKPCAGKTHLLNSLKDGGATGLFLDDVTLKKGALWLRSDNRKLHRMEIAMAQCDVYITTEDPKVVEVIRQLDPECVRILIERERHDGRPFTR